MINYNNTQNFKDRNGLDLQYGDKVIVRTYTYNSYNSLGIAQIIGFTDKFVVLIWCVGCGNNFCRLSKNIVKVTDSENWKHW